MKVFALKTCDTSRKAVRELRSADPDLQVVDVRADGVSDQDLARFFARFGQELLNKRSTTWRGLSEADQARDPLDLLRENPTLMKRPVIEANGQLFLGWDQKVRQAVLG